MTGIIDKLSGWKTYLAIAGWFVFEILNARHAFALDADAVAQIRATFLAATGISLRAGVQKAQNAAEVPDPTTRPAQ
jgi:hypothetical protein